ncbi:MAG: hypothetical protein QGG40_07690, partial [Myxococcota bacterium]|nr:hypothetical protein [Myxococcota bacterium]
PDLLASQVEALTGFVWSEEEVLLLETDTNGVRTLAGGMDGVSVTAAATHPNATLLLVQQRLAEAAADFSVTRDAALEPEERGFFTQVDPGETPDTAHDAMVEQVLLLQLRIFGRVVESDGDEVESLLGLWDEVYAIDQDPLQAWKAVVSVQLRDPDFLFY